MITTQELEVQIRELIKDIYKKEYIGKITIESLNPGYCIKFGLDMPEHPYVICAQLEDKVFLKFLKKELRHIKWFEQDYGGVALQYPVEQCSPIKKCCNDKG